jgi:hypothetical protein
MLWDIGDALVIEAEGESGTLPHRLTERGRRLTSAVKA